MEAKTQQSIILGKKNVLIQYKGGGYDGCFWEWNYAFIDSSGTFHDIFSSGRYGQDTMEGLEEYLKDESEYYIIDLDDPDSVSDFTKNSNPGHVIAAAQSLDKFGITIQAKCTCCGELVDAMELIPEGFEGCGGIAIQATEMICEDCNALYRCARCGEHYGKDHPFDDEGLCECCHDEKDESDYTGDY